MPKTATRNGKRNSRRTTATPAASGATPTTTRSPKVATRKAPAKTNPLTSRGVAVVALTSGTLVFLSLNGFAALGSMAGYALYLVVTGKGVKVARTKPDKRNAVRALSWAAASVAALAAVQGTTAPGGPSFGLALATAVVVLLRLTATSRRS